jgi:hypothetical protein
VHLKPLVRAGVKGLKCFLIESGVDVSETNVSMIGIEILIVMVGISMRNRGGSERIHERIAGILYNTKALKVHLIS